MCRGVPAEEGVTHRTRVPSVAPVGRAGLSRGHRRRGGCHPSGDHQGRVRGLRRPAGEVPSRAQRRRGRPTGGGNPIRGPDPASSPLPFPSLPSLPVPARRGCEPRRSAPRRPQPRSPEGTPGGGGALRPRLPAPHLPGPGGGGGRRRTWRCRAAATAAAAASSPSCCWLRASAARPRRGGASPAGKVGRAAGQDGGR